MPAGARPSAASFEFCRKSGFKEMPQRGIHSVTIPGAVHGWTTLLKSHGTKTLRDILQSAIRHAEEGFPVAELTAEQWKESEARLKADEGAAMNYLIDGRTPKAGEIFKNPADGEDVEADCGGWRGRFLRRRNRREDRALFRKSSAGFSRSKILPIIARIGSNRLRANYRGFDIYEMPPTTQGFVALEMLKILEGFDLKSAGRKAPTRCI